MRNTIPFTNIPDFFKDYTKISELYYHEKYHPLYEIYAKILELFSLYNLSRKKVFITHPLNEFFWFIRIFEKIKTWEVLTMSTSSYCFPYAGIPNYKFLLKLQG